LIKPTAGARPAPPGYVVLAYSSGALDGVRLKLSHLGGITPARQARDIAVALGLPMTVEDSGGGDVVTAAAMHVSCSVEPRFVLGDYLPSEMVAESIASGTPVAESGRARLPAGPGLGIDVDEAALGEPVARIE
jgi:L-alanine-DL-glutamate epimerase-like enolase superfamily enzyme